MAILWRIRSAITSTRDNHKEGRLCGEEEAVVTARDFCRSPSMLITCGSRGGAVYAPRARELGASSTIANDDGYRKADRAAYASEESPISEGALEPRLGRIWNKDTRCLSCCGMKERRGAN